MKRLRAAIATAGFSLLAACDSGSGTVFTPFLSFTYSGATSGSFDGAGSPPSDDSNKPWAAGARDVTDNTIEILAMMPASASSSHLVGIVIPDATGTVNFDPSCDDPGPTCASFFIFFGLSSDGSTVSTFCNVTTGAITITKVTETRAAGTFSGTGTCGSGTNQSTIAIAAGSFEVTINAQLPVVF